MAIIVSDSFNRENSTTSLGSTDSYSGGTLLTWTPSDATWGISNNKSYVSNGSGTSTAVVYPPVSDVTVSAESIGCCG